MTTTVRRVITARPWLTVMLTVVVAGTGAGVYLLSGGSGSGSAAPAATTSRLVTVAAGTLQESVPTTGTISPADEDSVSFGSSGQVTSVRVAVGDRVAEGQVLGTIDTLSLRAALAQDGAGLAGAQAQLATARSTSTTTAAQLSPACTPSRWTRQGR